MSERYDADVAIVGAGPVGMTLAIDLAQRGARVMIFETRAPRQPPSPKCNHISARSMETFRRLGIADRLRDAPGLPRDYPNDVVFSTTLTAGRELARIHIPGRNDRFSDRSGPDAWWPTPEPPHRMNQIDMEPVLFDVLSEQPGVDIWSRTMVESFEQDTDGVTIAARDLDRDTPITARARYVVGCDGGRSLVRKSIGAKFDGTPVLYDVQSTYFRAPDLLARLGDRPPWMAISNNTRRNGAIVAIDGREKWLLHNTLMPGETFDGVDRDWALRTILGVGDDFTYDIIAREDWTARRLVADRFRSGSIFICGDAAQLWVPMAGYGMNAGIASAGDLAWMLGAVVRGWAPDTLLDAYQAERHPINEQVSRFAMDHAIALMRQRETITDQIEDDDAAGDALRETVGAGIYTDQVQQFACGGLNFGYYYDRSPVIAYDDEPAPAYTMATFEPSTVPGCRVPYFALADGTPLYDMLGAGFTVIRFDTGVPVDALLAAAAARNVPLALLDVVDDPGIPAAYRHALVLARPDRHVAWRGDAIPDSPDRLIDLIRGAAVPDPTIAAS